MLGNNNLTKIRHGWFRRKPGRQKGFTVPELLISISILGIIAVSLLAIITNYLVLMTRNSTIIDMTDSSQNMLRAAVEELRYGAGVRQTNTITDPNGPAGGWNTSNSSFIIIFATPAVDSSRNYIIDPSTGNPYNNELVYYKQGTTLYKRTLADPNATGNSLQTSCPANLATTTCPADKELLDNLSDMTFTLYDQDDNVTSNPLSARSIKIDLSMYKDTFGQPLTLTNSIRATLRNQF